MLYLSVKTLGAFSNWPADMKVGHAGRNPSPLIAEAEISERNPEATTDSGSLITCPPVPETGARLEDQSERNLGREHLHAVTSNLFRDVPPYVPRKRQLKQGCKVTVFSRQPPGSRPHPLSSRWIHHR
jgi:hypothetical protein